MRVGIYVAGYAPETGGGHTFETEITQAICSLSCESHHEFVWLAPPHAAKAIRLDPRYKAIECHEVREESTPRWRRMLERESAIFRARSRTRSAIDEVACKAKVDFIWFVSAGAHRTDLPYLTVVWDVQHRVTPWFPEFSAKGQWDARELFHHWFLQRAAGVVTGTRTGQEELERFYQVPSSRTLILPHPTPQFALEDRFADASRNLIAQLGLVQPYVLYPAQFWAHKNHVNLVLALKLAREELKQDLQLALVGSDKGNGAHVMRFAQQQGLEDAVRSLGFVDRPTLIALYRHATALTYASWCGPENLPPLEAFALGCPVIATDIPGAREQLGDAALLVNPADPSEIASGICAVYRSEELKAKLVSSGRKRAEAWTAPDYVRGVFSFLDHFEPMLRCWSPAEHV